MGKGNRQKLIKAQAKSDSNVFTKSKKVKKENPAWVSTLVVILVVALLVSCIVLTIISEGGYMLRWTKVVYSDNYTITGTMMSYYFYSSYNSFLNQYGSYASYFGLDTSASLKGQKYGETTWFDYFMDNAINQAEKLCVYCEEAKVRGIKLDDEDYKDIDKAIDNLKSAANKNNYSVNGYVAALYGTGVNISDVRKALEISQLASKCSEIVQDELENAITADRVNTYYDENKTDFWTAELMSYAFKVSSTGSDASYDYEAEKAKIDALGAELLACNDKDSFKNYVAKYVAETNFDTLYNKEAEKYEASVLPDAASLATYKANVIAAAVSNAIEGKTVETTTSTETVDKIMNSIESSLTTKIETALDALTNSSYSYSDPTAEDASDEVKWVCDSARVAGDKTIISKTGDSDYTVTVYLMLNPMHRDETLSRNVGHILFTTSTYGTEEAAEKKANEILAEYKSGAMTKEAFAALAEKYNEDSETFYDDVIKGTMVTAFEDWLFDSSRVSGDVDVIKTDYGFHFMYYVGESSPTWYVKVKNTILSNDSEKWYNDKVAAFGVKSDKEASYKVNA